MKSASLRSAVLGQTSELKARPTPSAAARCQVVVRAENQEVIFGQVQIARQSIGRFAGEQHDADFIAVLDSHPCPVSSSLPKLGASMHMYISPHGAERMLKTKLSIAFWLHVAVVSPVGSRSPCRRCSPCIAH
jgi:hypothetical protein